MNSLVGLNAENEVCIYTYDKVQRLIFIDGFIPTIIVSHELSIGYVRDGAVYFAYLNQNYSEIKDYMTDYNTLMINHASSTKLYDLQIIPTSITWVYNNDTGFLCYNSEYAQHQSIVIKTCKGKYIHMVDSYERTFYTPNSVISEPDIEKDLDNSIRLTMYIVNKTYHILTLDKAALVASWSGRNGCNESNNCKLSKYNDAIKATVTYSDLHYDEFLIIKYDDLYKIIKFQESYEQITPYEGFITYILGDELFALPDQCIHTRGIPVRDMQLPTINIKSARKITN